jgi:hypothetical protein
MTSGDGYQEYRDHSAAAIDEIDNGKSRGSCKAVTEKQDRDIRAVKEVGQIFPLNKIDAVVRCKQETKGVSGHTLDTPGSLKGEKRFNRKIWMLLHSQ